jgi:hypothetical protein
MKRALLIIALIMFVVANNVYWFLGSVNHSLKSESLSSDLHGANEKYRVLVGVCLDITRETTRSQLTILLRDRYPELTVFERDGNIYAGPLSFIYDHDRIVEIRNAEVPGEG